MSAIGELIDAAASVPFLVWVAIIGFGLIVLLAYEWATAPLLTDEQRDEIEELYREYGGKGPHPSTRSRAATARRTHRGGAPSTRHSVADPVGPVWRGRPRRDHHT